MVDKGGARNETSRILKPGGLALTSFPRFGVPLWLSPRSLRGDPQSMGDARPSPALAREARLQRIQKASIQEGREI
jgi:hypothetical protein